MRFLVDMPLSPKLAQWLRAAGHDALHASGLGLHSAPDQALIELARQEGRILVTADLDFPRLLALAGDRDPAVVLFRGGGYSEAEAEHLMARVLARYPPHDLVACIVVADRSRLRRTRLPL